MSNHDDDAEVEVLPEEGAAFPDDTAGVPVRNVGGRPAFVPTAGQRLLVRSLAANRVPQYIIARNVLRDREDTEGISERTLRQAFRQELDEGYDRTVASMGLAVIRSGLGGNVLAQKYWLSTHAGDEWKTSETVRHGLTPDAQNAGALVAPVLVIQPVKAIDPTASREATSPPLLRIVDDGE